MLEPPVLFEGVRVRLRRSTPDDAEATYAAAHDADVMRYMEWPAHRSVTEARQYLEGCASRWASGHEYHWMVVNKTDGAAIGSIACRVRGHAADFGYFLARSHWGRGLATEAAGLLVSWMRRQPSLERIWATADAENRRSAAVLHKLGLQPEGVMRRATVRPNLGPGPRDTALFAWVRGDPPHVGDPIA
jgi:[ribosomal protein S5]-alanine N-acetyltransferase